MKLAGTLTTPEGRRAVPGRRAGHRLGPAGSRRDALRPQAVPGPRRRPHPARDRRAAGRRSRRRRLDRRVRARRRPRTTPATSSPGRRVPQDPAKVDRSEAIGLMGHSEGGVIAPIVAARAPDDVAFIVLLAGTGVPAPRSSGPRGSADAQGGRRRRRRGLDKVEAASSTRSCRPPGREGPQAVAEKKLEAVLRPDPRRVPEGERRPSARPSRSRRRSPGSTPPGSATSSPTTRGRPWPRSTARSWRSTASWTSRSPARPTSGRSPGRSGRAATTG